LNSKKQKKMKSILIVVAFIMVLVLPIQAQLAHDIGITEIIVPGDSAQIGDSVQVQVKVKNFGTNTLNVISIRYRVNGGSIFYSNNINLSNGLVSNADTIVSLSKKFKVPSSNFNFCAFSMLLNDANYTNDTLCKYIVATPANFDAGIDSAWVVPAWNDTTSLCGLDSAFIILRNYGLDTLTSIPIWCNLNNIPVSVDTWNGSLASGDTAIYCFITKFHSPIGQFLLSAEVHSNLDQNDCNDSASHVYIGIYDCEGIDESGSITFELLPAVPNPAQHSINLGYFLPSSGELRLSLYNALGQLQYQRVLNQDRGRQNLTLDVREWANGFYFYTLEFEGKSLSNKILIQH